LETVGYMLGKRIAVVLRMVCSNLGLEAVSRHKYLEHGEVLVGVLARPLVSHCCSTAVGAVGAVGDFAADVVGLAAAVVDDVGG